MMAWQVAMPSSPRPSRVGTRMFHVKHSYATVRSPFRCAMRFACARNLSCLLYTSSHGHPSGARSAAMVATNWSNDGWLQGLAASWLARGAAGDGDAMGGVGSEAVMEILSSVAQQQYTAARGAWYAARQCERILSLIHILAMVRSCTSTGMSSFLSRKYTGMRTITCRLR